MCIYLTIDDIKIHDSELQCQEEAGHMWQMSELFTRSTAQKFINVPDKSYCLVIKGSTSSNYIEPDNGGNQHYQS